MFKIRKLIGTIIYWVCWPGLFFLLNDTHRTRVIINVDNKVLLVRDWIGRNKLSLPGGGVKSNEASLNAAMREVYEETGIKIKLTDANMVVKKLSLKENGITTIIDCYFIKLPKIVSTHSENLEIMESIWVQWSKIIDTTSISRNSNQLLHIWLDKSILVD